MPHIVWAERQFQKHQNNVVLAGIPEELEDVMKLLHDQIPEVDGEICSTHRLGRALPRSVTPAARPHLVKGELSTRGKNCIWRQHRDLRHDDHPKFVNNDLAAEERARRKHQRLANELSCMGSVLNWLIDYLSCRQQQVVIEEGRGPSSSCT